MWRCLGMMMAKRVGWAILWHGCRTKHGRKFKRMDKECSVEICTTYALLPCLVVAVPIEATATNFCPKTACLGLLQCKTFPIGNADVRSPDLRRLHNTGYIASLVSHLISRLLRVPYDSVLYYIFFVMYTVSIVRMGPGSC